MEAFVGHLKGVVYGAIDLCASLVRGGYNDTGVEASKLASVQCNDTIGKEAQTPQIRERRPEAPNAIGGPPGQINQIRERKAEASGAVGGPPAQRARGAEAPKAIGGPPAQVNHIRARGVEAPIVIGGSKPQVNDAAL